MNSKRSSNLTTLFDSTRAVSSLSRETALDFSGVNLNLMGIHQRRTMMLSELSILLSQTASCLTPTQYKQMIVDENMLGKHTLAGRLRSYSYLKALYTLDHHTVAFWFMRFLSDQDRASLPLMACLFAQARDRLFFLSYGFIGSMKEGDLFEKNQFYDFLDMSSEHKYSDKQLQSLTRNLASSWQQSGHLRGRFTKQRQMVSPTASSVAYALFLSYLTGLKGENLFRSHWMGLLDSSDEVLFEYTTAAKRLGWLEFRRSGNIIDISFNSTISLWQKETVHEPD